MNFFLEHPALATYLFLKIDTAWGVLFCVGIIMFFWVAFIALSEYIDEGNYKNVPKGYLYTSMFLMSMSFIIPSQKDVAIIAGVSTGVTLAENVASSETTKKAYEALNVYINKELDSVIESAGKKK